MATKVTLDDSAGNAGFPLFVKGAASGKFLTINSAGEIEAVDPPSGGFEFPVGHVYLSVVSTNPATLFGYGTWVACAAGKALVGLDSGDAAFDAPEETGGSKTVAAAGSVSAPTFTGSALGTHQHGPGTLLPSAHSGTAVAQHAAGVTGAASAGAQKVGTTTSTVTLAAHTHTTPALSHVVTQPDAHTMGGSSEAVSGGTPAGTVSAPGFTGTPTSVLQPYFVVYAFKRTA